MYSDKGSEARCTLDKGSEARCTLDRGSEARCTQIKAVRQGVL